MNIFGILVLSFLIALVIGLIPMVVGAATDDNKWAIVALICFVVVFVLSPFVGIGISTNNERVYVQKYIAQKETIEASLDSSALTGLERVELVNKAVELNGEFAERKAKFDLWYHVHYDNAIYDGVAPIDLNRGVVDGKE